MSSPQDAQNTTNTQSQEDMASEMTPEAREIIGKAKRSFGFSVAILLLGFIAIVLALVYRSMRDGNEITIPYVQTQVSLPSGSEVLSVVPTSERITITYEQGGNTLAKVIDSNTGAVVADITIELE